MNLVCSKYSKQASMIHWTDIPKRQYVLFSRILLVTCFICAFVKFVNDYIWTHAIREWLQSSKISNEFPNVETENVRSILKEKHETRYVNLPLINSFNQEKTTIKSLLCIISLLRCMRATWGDREYLQP